MSSIPDQKFPDSHHDMYSKTVFGFWVYLLTDLILFGTLFAAYAVLRSSVFGGTPAHVLFHLPQSLTQALLLLFAAYFSGLGGSYAHRGDKNKTILYFALTFFLGLIFVFMEWSEFARFIASGNSWQRSAFLSAFFTLVGTHLGHIFFALLWTVLLLIPVAKEGSISQISLRRLTCLRMFWQFLNIVWVFIFTIVYLMGEIQ